MGYQPSATWVSDQFFLMMDMPKMPPAKALPLALKLTLDRAIGELQWKMDKTPEFDESGSITRVLHDLMAAREGVAILEGVDG